MKSISDHKMSQKTLLSTPFSQSYQPDDFEMSNKGLLPNPENISNRNKDSHELSLGRRTLLGLPLPSNFQEYQTSNTSFKQNDSNREPLLTGPQPSSNALLSQTPRSDFNQSQTTNDSIEVILDTVKRPLFHTDQSANHPALLAPPLLPPPNQFHANIHVNKAPSPHSFSNESINKSHSTLLAKPLLPSPTQLQSKIDVNKPLQNVQHSMKDFNKSEQQTLLDAPLQNSSNLPSRPTVYYQSDRDFSNSPQMNFVKNETQSLNVSNTSSLLATPLINPMLLKPGHDFSVPPPNVHPPFPTSQSEETVNKSLSDESVQPKRTLLSCPTAAKTTQPKTILLPPPQHLIPKDTNRPSDLPETNISLDNIAPSLVSVVSGHDVDLPPPKPQPIFSMPPQLNVNLSLPPPDFSLPPPNFSKMAPLPVPHQPNKSFVDTSKPPPIFRDMSFPPPNLVGGSFPPTNVSVPPPNLTELQHPSISNEQQSNQVKVSVSQISTENPTLQSSHLRPAAHPTTLTNTTLPPPNCLLAGHQSINSGPPPSVFANLPNTSLPPPDMDGSLPFPSTSTAAASVPTPSVSSIVLPTSFNLPPPGYLVKAHQLEQSSSEESKPTVTKDNYISELKDWYQQIEDYEQQMLEYFEMCASKLRVWYENGGDKTTEYRSEYAKLTEEYDKYMDYMKTLKEYYGKQVADIKQITSTDEPTTTEKQDENITKTVDQASTSVETGSKTNTEKVMEAVMPEVTKSQDIVSQPTTDIASEKAPEYENENNNFKPKPPIEVDNSIPPPPPVKPDETVAPPSEGTEADSSTPTEYYKEYYKKMIDYFSGLLNTMGQQPVSPGEENSGTQTIANVDQDRESIDTSENEEKQKLNKNQRKKLSRKNRKCIEKQTVKGKGKSTQRLEDPKPVSKETGEAKAPPSSMQSAVPQPAFVPQYPPMQMPPIQMPPVMNQTFDPSRPPPDYPAESQAMFQQFMTSNYGAGDWSGMATSLVQQHQAHDIEGTANAGFNWAELIRRSSQYATQKKSMSKPPEPPFELYSNSSTAHSSSVQNKGVAGILQYQSEDVMSDDELIGAPVRCEDCQLTLPNDEAYAHHLRDLRHLHKTGRGKSKLTKRVLEEEERAKKEALEQEAQHMEKVMSQFKCEKRKGLGLSGSHYCTLCNVECTSEKALDYHLQGNKHVRNLEQVVQTGAKSLVKKHRRKAPIRIQSILDTCLEALIGLNYVIEYQRTDPLAPCRYYCELCDHRFKPQDVISHVTGALHRKTFMKYNYHDMYEILDQDCSPEEIKMKRLDVFARKLEEYEGRKRLCVRNEVTGPELRKEKEKVIEEKRKEKEERDRIRREAAQELAIKRNEKRKLRRRERKLERRRAANEERERRLRELAAQGDMEDGEILSDEEEGEKDIPKSTSRRERRNRHSDAESEAESGAVTSSSVSSRRSRSSSRSSSSSSEGSDEDQESAEEGELPPDPEDERLEEEGELIGDLELAEFEELASTEKKPLTIQLSEDQERVEFIRRLKDKKMFKLKEAGQDAMAHFLFEADWVVERSRVAEAEKKARESSLREEKKRLAEEERKKRIADEMIKEQRAIAAAKSQRAMKALGAPMRQGNVPNCGSNAPFILPPLSGEMGPSRDQSIDRFSRPPPMMLPPQLQQNLPQMMPMMTTEMRPEQWIQPEMVVQPPPNKLDVEPRQLIKYDEGPKEQRRRPLLDKKRARQMIPDSNSKTGFGGAPKKARMTVPLLETPATGNKPAPPAQILAQRAYTGEELEDVPPVTVKQGILSTPPSGAEDLRKRATLLETPEAQVSNNSKRPSEEPTKTSLLQTPREELQPNKMSLLKTPIDKQTSDIQSKTLLKTPSTNVEAAPMINPPLPNYEPLDLAPPPPAKKSTMGLFAEPEELVRQYSAKTDEFVARENKKEHHPTEGILPNPSRPLKQSGILPPPSNIAQQMSGLLPKPEIKQKVVSTQPPSKTIGLLPDPSILLHRKKKPDTSTSSHAPPPSQRPTLLGDNKQNTPGLLRHPSTIQRSSLLIPPSQLISNKRQKLHTPSSAADNTMLSQLSEPKSYADQSRKTLLTQPTKDKTKTLPDIDFDQLKAILGTVKTLSAPAPQPTSHPFARRVLQATPMDSQKQSASILPTPSLLSSQLNSAGGAPKRSVLLPPPCGLLPPPTQAPQVQGRQPFHGFQGYQ